MATSIIGGHSPQVPSLKTQATQTSVFWYSFAGILATIATFLHLVQPDLDFRCNASIFLWPFSPLRIASPFSVFYSFYLGLLIADFERNNAWKPKSIREAELRQRLDDLKTAEVNFMILAGSLSASTLSKDIPTLYLKGLELFTTDVPTYEAGNVSVELAWAGMILLAVIYGLLASALVIFAWHTPSKLIMYKWKTVKAPKTNKAPPSSDCAKERLFPSTPANLNHEDSLLRCKTKGPITTAASSPEGAPHSLDITTAGVQGWTLVGPGDKYDDMLHGLDAIQASLVSMRGQLEDQCKQENKEVWKKECQRLADAVRASQEKCQKMQ